MICTERLWCPWTKAMPLRLERRAGEICKRPIHADFLGIGSMMNWYELICLNWIPKSGRDMVCYDVFFHEKWTKCVVNCLSAGTVRHGSSLTSGKPMECTNNDWCLNLSTQLRCDTSEETPDGKPPVEVLDLRHELGTRCWFAGHSSFYRGMILDCLGWSTRTYHTAELTLMAGTLLDLSTEVLCVTVDRAEFEKDRQGWAGCCPLDTSCWAEKTMRCLGVCQLHICIYHSW